MTREKRTPEFKKEVVTERLKGVALKTVCKKYGVWPPQVLKWMKEFGDDPDLEKLRKNFEMMKSRRRRATTLTAATARNVLMRYDANDETQKEAFFALLRRHGGLHLKFNGKEKAWRVYDELTRL